MTASPLSFNFNEVEIDLPNLGDIPVDEFLPAKITKAENYVYKSKTTGEEQPGIRITQDVMLPGNRSIEYRQNISPKQGFILAMYLNAVGKNFKDFTGKDLGDRLLSALLVGQWVSIKFERYESAYHQGQERTRVKRVEPTARPVSVGEPVSRLVEDDDDN